MDIPIPLTQWTEDEPLSSMTGRRTWRHVLVVEGLPWPSIGVRLDVKFNTGEPEEKDFMGLHAAGWTLRLDPVWSFDEEHIYYDGCHCLYSFGFLRLILGSTNCSKCQQEA